MYRLPVSILMPFIVELFSFRISADTRICHHPVANVTINEIPTLVEVEQHFKVQLPL
jgi:hypothetical protein